MALEYFLYDTTYGNTLVNRSNVSFAPSLPYDQIYIDYFIPDIQPLFLYRESGGTIIHNQQSIINEYVNSLMPPATPTDYIQYSTFSDYSGTTATLINTKLTSSNFATYTGTTAPNTFLNKIAFNVYSGTTLPANYYNKIQINSYTGITNTAIGNKLATTIYQTYTGTTIPNLLSAKLATTTFNTYTGITVPNTYYNKTQINSYTGTTNTAINNRLLTSIYQTYTGITAPNTFLNKTACACDSKCFNAKLPAYYLNTGSTAICATCAIGAKSLCGCVPASFLLSGGTAVCATTAGNALCLNNHTEANLSVANSACLGGNLAVCYQQKAGINTYTGTTVPANYYNKTQINSYTGTTNTAIGNRLLTTIFNTYTGTTLPANYYNKTQINSYTGSTKTTLNAKAYLSGATFTGVVNVCKPAQNDNSNCVATTSWYISQAGTANPLMNNIVCVGISNLFSRQDHVHPRDTSKLSLSGGTLTGMLYGTSLNLSGDLTVLGTMHTVHEEQIYSTKDFIFLRSGNTQSLGVGKLSGIAVMNADAVHTVVLGADKNAVMRVGWSGDTYIALAGREDNPHNGWYARWDSGTTKFVTYDLDTTINAKLTTNVFNGFTGTTLPANYYNKTQINSYTGATNTAIGNRLLTTVFNIFTGTTLPANYYNKIQINSYTGITAPVINTAITGATNGLTNFDGRNLCLGGTLNNDVVIDLNTCKIKFINGSVVSCGATSQGFDSYNDYKLSGQTILSIPNRNFSFGNLAFGSNTLCSNISGCYNIALGNSALLNSTTGCYNTALGNSALLNSTTGCYNTANGSNALLNNTCGCGNVAIGFDALYCNLIGNYNTALGSQTLFFNTCGCNNVAIGNSALFYNSCGNNNVATGINALFYNSCGNNNVANGFFALYHNLTGCNNIALGYQALCSNTCGCNNIVNGYNALLNNTCGCNNIANGYNALYCNKTGSTNVAIGYNAGYCEIGSNKLYIANSNTVNPLIYGEFNNRCIKINGNLIITGNTCSNKFIENGTCLGTTYLTKTTFSTYTGTTEPNTYYNKTQINSYTGNTNTAIGNRLLTSAFNTYSGATNTLILNRLLTSAFNIYSGATLTLINGKLGTAATAADSSKLGGILPAGYLLSGGTAKNSTCLNGQLASYYLASTACAADSAKLNNKLPSYYLNTGSTALCASTAGNALALCGCVPSCFLGATVCAVDSAKLNNKLPAYYLNTGSTALCATCAGNASTVAGCTPSCFLGATATAVCATCAISSKALCGCVPASFLLSGGTAVCATTAGNALCLNGHTEAALNVCNAVCVNGHTEANLSVANSACLGGNLAVCYQQKAGINTYTGTTVPNTYLTKTTFSTYTGTTAPNTYYNKTQINSYTGATSTSINNRLLTIIFNTYTGTTVPNTYYNKTQINSYTGVTSTAIGLKANIASPTFTGTVRSVTPATNDNSTCIATTAWYIGQCGTALPLMDGTANAGISTLWAHQDHVHPRDTTKANLSGATFTGLITANLGATISGAIISLNSSSNFATNINDGISTGTITLGGTGIQAINIGTNTGVKTICIGNNNAPANLIDIGGNLSVVCIGGLTNIIGIAGASNCNGVRIGASRVSLSNKPTAPLTALNANCTLSVTQVLEMGIVGYSASAIRCLTLPTACGASGLVQALPCAQVGDVFTMLVYNTCTFGVCICGGTNVTVVSTNCATCTNTPRTLTFRVTSVSVNAETISVY